MRLGLGLSLTAARSGGGSAFPYDFLATDDASLTAALASAAANPTVDQVIAVAPGTYGARTITTVMSGTITGVPVSDFVESERGGAWDAGWTGGSITIRGLPGSNPVFNSGITLNGASGIAFRDVTIGRLQPIAQYAYEPEPGEEVSVTGVTIGNPTIISVSGGQIAKLRVGAKLNITGIVGTTILNNKHLDILANSGTTVTVDYDSTGQPAWVSGGSILGASNLNTNNGDNPAGISVVAFEANSGARVICRDVRFSNYDLTTNAEFWSDLIGQGSHDLLVLQGCDFDGFNNGVKCGQGDKTLFYGCKWRRGLSDYVASRGRSAAVARLYAPTRTITSITAANPPVVTTSAAHGLVPGNAVCLEGVGGMTEAITDQSNGTAISGITVGATTVVSVAQTSSFTIGSTAKIIGLNGGPTALNDVVARVTARSVSSGAGTVTLAYNSTGFPAYSSGGTLRRAFAWMVESVPSSTTFTISTLNTETETLSGTVAVDGSGWTAYTSGGTMIGPLFSKHWWENCYEGEQASDARFAARHSDGAQFAAAANEIPLLARYYDGVIAPVIAPETFNTTQAFFMQGGETDNAPIFGAAKNLLLASSGPNQFVGPRTRKHRWEQAYITTDRQPGQYFISSDGLVEMPPQETEALSCIFGTFAENAAVFSDIGEDLSPNESRATWFEGTFALDSNGNYRPSDVASTGSASAIIATYAAQYKGVGANAGRGFGADPDGIYKTATFDTGNPVISGISITPTSGGASVAWSVDKSKGFAYYVVGGDGGISDPEIIIDLARYDGGTDRGIVGLSAAGSQAALTLTGLVPSTAYSLYIVVRDRHGNTSLTETVFSTTALAEPVIEQTVLALSTSSNANNYTSTTNPVVGSSTNRMAVALVSLVTSTPGNDTSGTTVTLNGVSMTLRGSVSWSGGSGLNTRIGAFVLPAPAAGSSPIVVTCLTAGLSPVTVGGCVIRYFELSNADQTAANYSALTAAASASTGLTTSGSVANNDSLLLSALAVLSGDFSGQIAANGGATLVGASSTGTSANSDMTNASSTEVVATSGTNGNGFTWTTAANAAMLTLICPKP